MPPKEAKARIKINNLLETAGWRFFDSNGDRANILLENNVKITKTLLDEYGEDFERTTNGFVDFLLLDKQGFPFIVLEAKAEDKNPLFAKEQARKYAVAQNCRFIILSNGNLHYFWDLERGNPHVISRFPSPETVKGFSLFKPDWQGLTREIIGEDYIALTQKPDYKNDPDWQDPLSRENYNQSNKLRFLRKYQVSAVESIQEAVKKGKDRFLFEMATGTGKTLVAAVVIKLFLRTGNARRVLFLVDRLELEDQAWKAFVSYLKNDFKTVIYKENRDDWRKAEIVVSTIQTFLATNRYKRLFSPDDFDLVISDEAHRSIGGNSRAVFEYFIGFKLGLTATPKNYLKNIDPSKMGENDPRELERRLLLDTYKTFGCENEEPTYRYSLMDGVKEGFLVNPFVVDARTEITTQLLSEKGYAVLTKSDTGEDVEETYVQKDFERKFFSDTTNRTFCQTFLKNAFMDPISGEMGKTIIFCVSQNHAAKITQFLNEYADQLFPGKYHSDFAIQVTSRITDSQQFSINFSNNKLSGSCNFIPEYKTSKTRVCVTVGMMTTGYDCQDILNLCLMRPIFSPTDFIQIKGRGTRIYNFTGDLIDQKMKDKIGGQKKRKFKMFDFFANCEYFEEKYDYDEVIPLPKYTGKIPEPFPEPPPPPQGYENFLPDDISKITEKAIGYEGMKIDRMYFEKFEKKITELPVVKEKIEQGKWEELIDFLEKNIMDQPEEFFTLEKLRASIHADRRIPLKEIIEKIMGIIPYFKTRNELLDEEFDKFDSRYLPKEEYFSYARTVFKAYILDSGFRDIVDKGNFSFLNVSPYGESFQKLSPELRKAIPDWIKDFVPLNKFAA